MKRSLTPVAAPALAAAIFLLAACGGSGDSGDQSGDEQTGDGETSSESVTQVDTMFGTIEIPQPEDGELTVVALGWSDAEVALALGQAPAAVFDWQAFGPDNKGVGPWATDLYGDTEPMIIEYVGEALDYESIQGIDPDLILNTRSGGDEAEFTRLSEIAPTVYAPEGTPSFGTKWDIQTQLIADALGKSEEGEQLVADVQAQIDEAAAANPQFEGNTAVAGTKYGDEYGAYITGDARWDLIEGLGFTQNPAVLEYDAAGFYVPLSVEQTGALDADVAVMFPIGYTLDEMRSDDVIAALDVVAEDRTVFLEQDAEVTQAFSAASPLSIPIAIDGIVPQLAEIID